MTIRLRKPKPFLGFQVIRFVDPDTRFKFQGTSIQGICQHIRTYRSQNNLPELEFLEDVVVNYNCMLKENLGVCEPSPTPLRRGLIQTIRGGIALIQNLMYSSFAPQNVADVRSEICKNCTLNSFPDKTKFVKWSDDLALQTIGDRKSKYHDELGTCLGCSCPLRCKVFYNGTISLEKVEQDTMRKANPKCWQLPRGKEVNGHT